MEWVNESWLFEVHFTDLEGLQKTYSPIEFKFGFHIDYLVGLADSLLVFHANGVEVSSLTMLKVFIIPSL